MQNFLALRQSYHPIRTLTSRATRASSTWTASDSCRRGLWKACVSHGGLYVRHRHQKWFFVKGEKESSTITENQTNLKIADIKQSKTRQKLVCKAKVELENDHPTHYVIQEAMQEFKREFRGV